LGTGFCFARHTSTASIISSVKPMTFFTGCVPGRQTFRICLIDFDAFRIYQINEPGGSWNFRALALTPTMDPDHMAKAENHYTTNEILELFRIQCERTESINNLLRLRNALRAEVEGRIDQVLCVRMGFHDV
jgi:hypothetical protein